MSVQNWRKFFQNLLSNHTFWRWVIFKSRTQYSVICNSPSCWMVTMAIPDMKISAVRPLAVWF